MENFKTISYLDFLVKIQGKNEDEIYKMLQEENVFVTEISSTDEFLIVGEIIDRIRLCDTRDSNQYSFLKRSIIYFGALEHLTNFNISSLDMGMENYNIVLEVVLQKNYLIKHYYQTINDVLRQEELVMIRELDKLFNKMPSIQDLDTMQDKLKNMFSGESDDRLRLIEGILAYNDPTMKEVKDMMLNMDNFIDDNDIKGVIDKATVLLEKEIKEDGESANGDKSK